MESNSSGDILQAMAGLFLHISLSENHIERARERLCNVASFDLFQAFNYLDRQSCNFISPSDLLLFLREQGVECCIEVLNDVVFFYNGDKKGALTYSGFIALFLSNDNYSLNKSARGRLWSNSLQEPIDKEVLDRLIAVIKSEICFVNELIAILDNMHQLKGFSVKATFDLVQANGFITPSSLMKLFTSSYTNCSFDDVANVMKRLDFNKDNKIDFNEFNGLLQIGNCVEENRFQKSKGNEFTNNTSHPHPHYSSTEMTHLQLSPTEGSARVPHKNVSTRSLNELEGNLEASCSLMIREAPHLSNNTLQTQTTEECLVIFLLTMMDIELIVEKKKCELALRDDFNIETLFHLFKSNSQLSTLTSKNLIEGMSLFNITISDKDFRLFMRRFNLSGSGSMNYAELFDVFIPFEKEYRDICEKRAKEDYFNNKPHSFLFATHKLIQDLLNKLLEYENHLETIRHTFTSTTLKQMLTSLFNTIDQESHHFITSNAIYSYLTTNRQTDCTMRECNLLHIRLDKNRTGVIELNEFINEYLPSPI